MCLIWAWNNRQWKSCSLPQCQSSLGLFSALFFLIVPVQKAQLLERMLHFLPFSCPAAPILTNRTGREVRPVNKVTYSSHTCSRRAARVQRQHTVNVLALSFTRFTHSQQFRHDCAFEQRLEVLLFLSLFFPHTWPQNFKTYQNTYDLNFVRQHQLLVNSVNSSLNVTVTSKYSFF